jgi:hypothetical protein
MCAADGGPVFHPDPEEEIDRVTFHYPPKVVLNRRPKLKMAAKVGVSATSKSISGTQLATGVSGTVKTAAAVLTGAAVTVPGAGLAAGAVAGMVISGGFAARSYLLTVKHIKGLQDIYDKRERYKCLGEINDKGRPVSTEQSDQAHDIIISQVLPYIIYQKVKKKRFKAASVLPITSPFATLYAVANKWGKAKRGELGKDRRFAAKWLASHLILCDCQVSREIVAELFNEKDLETMLYASFDEVWPLLEGKMKST